MIFGNKKQISGGEYDLFLFCIRKVVFDLSRFYINKTVKATSVWERICVMRVSFDSDTAYFTYTEASRQCFCFFHDDFSFPKGLFNIISQCLSSVNSVRPKALKAFCTVEKCYYSIVFGIEYVR